ncbi:type II secretion system minor pseudopilin GspJ [Cocleimonas sp. KMM 6892]|jgi:general secretion pathway protein J|uniref:type II secretion system minor pseudopilin GspJ n=1 Tax=unclassified Cocleimonas TaxID=2639732 RepID=UPI002DB8CCC0|nr:MULTISPECIES: type II secretion system minor pseudopilin GspJ [unclassified Cocleimonas]MEB8430971.1 type II secretion system minor pseudopilin GspJ [Cocleimonas sp. KMM 6892]MEC4714257.1 type II secretion system minor pseudopilin GspJ [Cocleimonas sp. KMM 6895]MEC4743588.1 type II secretion system minor pseudopilin GspJ [Cocleimonas sp. KMM 6896]
MKSAAKGFTLLELLVAMSIFSFMAITAYAGLSNMLTSNQAITEQEQKLKELQRTMLFLEKDIRQVVSRPRKTGYDADEVKPAFSYGLDSDDSEGILEFTKAGVSNPLALAKSSLERVRYDLEEEVLTRNSWAYIDHIDLEPVEMTLLTGVESLELRLLDDKDQWQSNWSDLKALPVAVEVTLEHKYWGKIIRLFPIR